MNRATHVLYRAIAAASSIACLALGIGVAHAQPFPSRPLELVVPFAAGQAPDAVARALAEHMSRQFGQQVVVVNRPGAGGGLGYKYVQSRKPDGYTMVLSSNSISTAYYSGMMPFDYTALDTAGRVTLEFPVLTVRADSSFNNLKDLVAHVRKHPGQMSVGSTSIGSHMHLTLVAFFGEFGLEVNAVPFPTAGQVTSLIGGHIDAVITLPGSLAGQVRGGKLKALAVLASRREPVFPDVPTATEQGFAFESDLWRAIHLPKGTPRAVIQRLEEAIQQAASSPEFKRLGDNIGFLPAFQGADAFAKTIAADDAMIAKVMTKAGLRTTNP